MFTNYFYFSILFLFKGGLGLRTESCSSALGMSSGSIGDHQIKVSSEFDQISTGKQHARLRVYEGGGAWCPLHQINHTTKEWIQIDFEKEMIITGIATEGRYDKGFGMEYAPAYQIEYWRNGLDKWAAYKNYNGSQIINGNRDTNSIVYRQLDGAVLARRIRIVPISNSTRTVCMKLEIYGCENRDLIESYSAPSPLQPDGSYDGLKWNNVMKSGIGKLHDGTVGERYSQHPEQWLAWKKTKNVNSIDLEFDLKDRSNISIVSIYYGEDARIKAESPSSVQLSFFARHSDEPEGPPVVLRHLDVAQTANEYKQGGRWIRIPFLARVASVVKIRLLFSPSSEMMLLSEVNIEYDPSVTTGSEEVIMQENNSTFWIYIFIICALLSVSVMIISLSVYFQRLRSHRVKASSPSPSFNSRTHDVKIAMHGSSIRHFSPSTYKIVIDNEQNSLLEKQPIEDSDYAEPDIEELTGLSPPLYHSVMESVYNTDTMESTRSPLSPLVKFSDYGEVYCSTLPELDRNKLAFIGKIGQGEFGEVHVCQLENRKVAVKRLLSTKNDEEMAFQREIRVLGSLKHTNIVEIVGVCTLEKPILCVMEYMGKGDLKTYLSKIDNLQTSLCVSICTQLAAGLAHMESCNFVHRDIAARNCLVDDDGNVKIGDFGMARSLYSSEYYQMNGNFVLPIRWMAPEALLIGRFTSQSDVWSFGVTMWEVFSGCRNKPFSNLREPEIMANVQHIHSAGRLQQQLIRPALCPPEIFTRIIMPCWRIVPIERPTFETLHLNLQSLIHNSSMNRSFSL